MLRVSVKRSEKQIFTRAERFCNDVVAAQTKEKKTKETQDIICYDQSFLQFRLAEEPPSGYIYIHCENWAGFEKFKFLPPQTGAPCDGAKLSARLLIFSRGRPLTNILTKGSTSAAGHISYRAPGAPCGSVLTNIDISVISPQLGVWRLHSQISFHLSESCDCQFLWSRYKGVWTQSH